MAKERLSRLQKWILVEALENDGCVPSRHYIYEGFWGKDKVWRYSRPQYWNGRIVSYKYVFIDNRFCASASRSLRILLNKEFLFDRFDGLGGIRHPLKLTEVGIKRAMSLKLSSMDVNNKKKTSDDR